MAVVRGRVQGVNFRNFVARRARALGIAGSVRNLADGVSVEVEAEGAQAALEELLRNLREGPALARVDAVEVTWRQPQGRRRGFDILW